MKRLICLVCVVTLLATGILALAEEQVDAVSADTLRQGDTGEAVSQLQTRLKALQYYTGPVSGQYGAQTAKAVRAVQTAYGLEETGEADADTVEIIYGECYRPLQYGDEGEDVKLLQGRLGELGYYTDKASGKYLKNTQAAVKTFQSEFGLEANGKADVETQQTLFAAQARPDPTPTPAPGPTPTLGPHQDFPGTLQYGSKSANVQKVQQRLMDLGFFTYYKTTQGYYRHTQEAVKAFQKYNGLEQTGTVDESTWNALFNDETVVASTGVPKPTPEPQPVPYAIEVDVNNQVTKIWKYNAETKDYTDLYKSFLCSTGTKSNPSEVGTFVLTARRARWCYFSKWGGSKAQYWTRINSDIAFHSLIYADYDEMTLKVSSLNNLGSRASHGCIRLTVADAKWIYDNCGAGTVVTIHEDGVSAPELKQAIQPGKLDKSVMLPKTTPAPTQAPAYDGNVIPTFEIRTLSNGKSGEDVYWLQMKLKELGYYQGTVTGTYLGGTQKAVKAFQKANKLSQDGTAGKAVFNALFKMIEEANATPVPTDTVPPTETPAPTVTPPPES